MSKEDFEELMELLESLMETLEVLMNEEFKLQIERSLHDIREGRIYEIKDEEDLKKLLFEE